MALLLSPTVSFLVSPSAPRSRALYAAANVSYPASRLQCKNLSSLQSPLNVTATCASFAEKRPVLVHATAEGSEAGAEQPEEPKPATKIEDMPLESKQKMIMEQRARMKIAKKLRHRRKRLLRKRKLRKKGRWLFVSMLNSVNAVNVDCHSALALCVVVAQFTNFAVQNLRHDTYKM